MRRKTTIAILAGICAALAITPAAAMGKTVKFQGPVDQPFIPGNIGFSRDMPTIEMKVTFSGKPQKPTVVGAGTLKVKGIYGPCLAANGCKPVCLDVNGVCDPPQCFPPSAQLESDVKIKKGRFSTTMRLSADHFTTVTGRVSKRSVRGTVQAHSYYEATSDRPAYTCDTGVLTYTATK